MNSTEVEFSGASDDLDTDIGLALAAGVWKDSLLHKNLSLGVQFARHQDTDFSEGTNAVVLGATLTGTATFEQTSNVVLGKVAYRMNEGLPTLTSVKPYAGVGVGALFFDADISAAGTITVNGTQFVGAGSASDSDVAPAGQFFAGVDYDINEKVYVGLNVSYLMANPEVFGAEFEVRNFTTMAKIGVKF